MGSQGSQDSSPAIRVEDLSEFQRWANDTEFFVDGKRAAPDAFDYLTGNVPFAGAVCVVQLVWPGFIEYKGCVIRRDAFDERRFEEWWSARNGHVQAIEGVMNHLHLVDLFPSVDGDETAEKALEQMARRLQQTWGLALAERFPHRQFEVTLDQSWGPTLSFTSVNTSESDATTRHPRRWFRR